jgi:hypothetical protein
VSAQIIAFAPRVVKAAAAGAKAPVPRDWKVCRKFDKTGADTHFRLKLAGGWHFDLHKGRALTHDAMGWQVFVNAPGVPCVGKPYPGDARMQQPRKPEAWFPSFDEATRYAAAYAPLIQTGRPMGPLPFIPTDTTLSLGSGPLDTMDAVALRLHSWAAAKIAQEAPGWLSEYSAAIVGTLADMLPALSADLALSIGADLRQWRRGVCARGGAA